MKQVTTKEAKALVDEGWTYLDVRSEPEFEQAHPAGAWNVPIMTSGPGGMAPNPNFLKVVEGAFGKSARLLIGCQFGGRSARAVGLLEEAGFSELVHFKCGFDGVRDNFGRIVEPGWAAEALPVETGGHDERSYRALAKKVP